MRLVKFWLNAKNAVNWKQKKMLAEQQQVFVIHAAIKHQISIFGDVWTVFDYEFSCFRFFLECFYSFDLLKHQSFCFDDT